MDAIRNSEDRYRTLESFWHGQLKSKVWLIENIKKQCKLDNFEIVIHGGWNGVLANLFFNSGMNIDFISSVDIDIDCLETCTTINKRWEMAGKFKAECDDMTTYQYTRPVNLIINTSAEHVTDEQLLQWYNNIPTGCYVAIQSNNFHSLEEHINCVNRPSQLLEKFPGFKAKEYVLPLVQYKRYMLIGKKDV